MNVSVMLARAADYIEKNGLHQGGTYFEGDNLLDPAQVQRGESRAACLIGACAATLRPAGDVEGLESGVSRAEHLLVLAGYRPGILTDFSDGAADSAVVVNRLREMSAEQAIREHRSDDANDRLMANMGC